MTPAEIVTRMKRELNRPAADDFFDPADDGAQYYDALTDEVRDARKKVSVHVPNLLYVNAPALAATDSEGRTYTLTDDHLAELEVWTPPGVNQGRRLYPGSPGQVREGFWLHGKTLHLTRPVAFSPGLYLRWIPATFATLSAASQSTGLPVFFDDYLLWGGCARMARRPNSGLDPRTFEGLRDESWFGRPGDPSDVGILGTLKKHASQQGVEYTETGSGPWWRGLKTFSG